MALSGGAVAVTTTCADAGTYTLSTDEGSDATYTYNLVQTDRAGNVSAATELVWHRISEAPAPVVIVSPASPFVSNGDQLTITGTCDDGLQVVLSGDVIAEEVLAPAGTLAQACSSGEYLFTIAKSVDNAYSLSLQQSYFGVTSEAVSIVWQRDTTGPLVQIGSGPSDPNSQSFASFSFSSVDAVEFHCKIDTGEWTTCVSGVSYTDIPSGQRLFTLRGADAAGNLTTEPAVYSWFQESYNTVALYHFDNSASGYEADASINGRLSLTDNGTTTVAGRFGEARQYQSSTMSTPDQPGLSLLKDRFTIELWMHGGTLNKSASYSLISQQSPGDFGFELGVYRQGGSQNYRLQMQTSRDGVTIDTQASNTFADPTNAWHHIVVTYDNGTIVFYLDGAIIGSVAGSDGALHDSQADLVIGAGPGGQYLGLIDELRISQTLRYSTAFTPPTDPFTAD